MQFQADVLGTPVVRAQVGDLTALGAAYLAGLRCNIWPNLNHDNAAVCYDTFIPCQDEEKQVRRYKGWKMAVKCAQVWASMADD